jgi:hypothetical protein
VSRKHRRRAGKVTPCPGNIKATPLFDPFPTSGLVKQFEPFIKKWVARFLKQYPRLDRQDVMFRAVELAHAAELTFKPELGFSFATHVGYRLRELHRLHKQLEAAEGVEIYRTKEDLAHEEAEEAGEPTAPVNFAGGGNGPRLTFDLQWWEALLSDVVRHITSGPAYRLQRWLSGSPIRPAEGPIVPRANGTQLIEGHIPTAKRVHRVKLGTQLGDGVDAIGAQARISESLPQVLKQQPPSPTLIGWIKAVIDHHVRRQRETDSEAEKRLAGDHSPTFLDALRNAVDVRFYKGRRSPRFLAKYMPMARLDDAYSHQDGDSDWKTSLHDTIAGERAAKSYEQECREALKKAAAIRPTLTNKNDVAMLDALVARLNGNAVGGLTAIAKDIGITKGAASKVARRLMRK